MGPSHWYKTGAGKKKVMESVILHLKKGAVLFIKHGIQPDLGQCVHAVLSVVDTYWQANRGMHSSVPGVIQAPIQRTDSRTYGPSADPEMCISTLLALQTQRSRKPSLNRSLKMWLHGASFARRRLVLPFSVLLQ